ncbi:thioredoxin family protein [Teredinibacter purpureus]|jgi:Thiol-disulfide isomerase and thioredoxins|uniref:thioredoxin family protein n=1 Tax=Teredinibacter purpureus TaxID=2731756 RepID=UPI0005F80C5E|nr:thioredoxin family protein [Teredinibacter purpureus]
MALTQSTMMPLQHKAPDFSLPSTDGEQLSLQDFDRYKALVVLFICNHCPYVIHIAPALAALAKAYKTKGIGFVAINSNDASQYESDNFENMKAEKSKQGYDFPYLFDETQSVAHAYSAACTPDIYVFDQHRKLVYRGQFDDSRPHRISSGNYDSLQSPSTGSDLKNVLDLLLDNKAVPDVQIPSMGCNIKWKDGNAPDYFG